MSKACPIYPGSVSSGVSEKGGLKERVQSVLSSQGIHSHTPCLKLEVLSEEGKTFSMSAKEARRLFENFGEVSSLRVLDSVILVLFADITSAYLAQKVLDGRQIDKLSIKLQVSWYQNQEAGEKRPTKFTCRFEIQIPNDKNFQVARKIIGHRGKNMKRILSKCARKFQGQAHDIVKLRLRGKGSGFKEGPENIESEEPLHLCVSSKYEGKYKVAVSCIEILLGQIYKDYDAYLRKRKLTPRNLEIQKIENTNGHLPARSLERFKQLQESKNLSEKDVRELIDIRNEARRQCNFSQADVIREMLKSRGVILKDEKGARGKGLEVTKWTLIH